jgi:leucyl-tRNA---protein transferase
MESLFHYVAPPSQCGYLPAQTWSLEYDLVQSLTAGEYADLLASGWRRFGRALFRPRCQSCQACQPLRVVVDRFQPNRSQRRVARVNDEVVQVQIQQPRVTSAKLSLYDKYHAYQADAKGWPQHPAKDGESYANAFVKNPFVVQEWCYYLRSQLVGVGYVDSLPGAMSAIYFFYDPELRKRSLGIWNVLGLLSEAARCGVPHLYLGYYVAGCGSMEYKATFRPCEVRGLDGVWRPFRE